MSGLGEVLAQNARLRDMVRERDARLAAHRSPLFEGLEVAAPPRDPVFVKEVPADPVEKKPDRRKTAKHPRKGRRDVSALKFPRLKVEAPVNPSTCETCGGDRGLPEPRVSHRVGWVPGQFTVVEVHR